MSNQKTKSIDWKWLPPAEEWDFRSVAPGDCRVACHWEYERQSKPPAPMNSSGYKFYPPNYRQAARDLFPQVWTTLTREQREKVLASFSRSPVIQAHRMREFFKRLPPNGSNPEILQNFFKHAYVVIPDFQGHGVEAVIKEFEKWARKEARQHPKSRRAQAAEVPFDALKWLAAARLDQARRKAKVTIDQARETVLAYRKNNPRPDPNAVLPVYASDGAWIKAVKNFQDCQLKSTGNPSYLLAELA